MRKKHKYEFWNYSILDWQEMEKHLNEMAANGFRFKSISFYSVSMACYDVTLGDCGKRYAVDVDMTPTLGDFEEYKELYKDAGWTMVFYNEKYRLCIFESSAEKQCKPLYSDTETKMEVLSNHIEAKGLMSRKIFGVLGICLAWFLLYKTREVSFNSSDIFIRVIIGVLIGYSFIYILKAFGEYIYMMRIKDYSPGDVPYNKPSWLNKTRRIMLYYDNITWLISWGVGIGLYMCRLTTQGTITSTIFFNFGFVLTISSFLLMAVGKYIVFNTGKIFMGNLICYISVLSVMLPIALLSKEVL
ncbi:MAG: DUF2812 domain-containing protein [Eubacteriales bacterium]|nr:DUF2812 domain-containing protein [Eubacteriales bacterium]